MTQQTSGVETINSFITPKGIHRTLQVEVKPDGIDIDFTLKSDNSGAEHFRTIELNRREALALVFYLIRKLLPNKFLINKKQEKREEKE